MVILDNIGAKTIVIQQQRVTKLILSNDGKELGQLLESGGDDRSLLNPKGVNKYFTSIYPDPSILHRGSCTSSTPTPAGFAAALGVWKDLKARRKTHSEILDNIRDRLKIVFDLKADEVLLTPSGSDAELIPLLIAVHRARTFVEGTSTTPKVLSLVTCAGEVGSGTANAACGRHFSEVVPSGRTGVANAGQELAGFSALAEITMKELKPRDDTAGDRIADYDEMITKLIDTYLTENPNAVVVLHVVEGSKTGLCMPSASVAQNLTSRYGGHIVTVVDACQTRSTTAYINQWVSLGAIPIITGSKFYNGPPFSAAVLIPQMIARELCDRIDLEKSHGITPVPVGLYDYIAQDDVPRTMASLRNAVGEWQNVSLALRWCAGLYEMENLKRAEAAHPGLSTTVAQGWISGIHTMIQQTPLLDVLKNETDLGRDTRVGACNTVVAFFIRQTEDSAPLNVDQLKLVHKWLWMDISSFLPAEASAEERRMGALRCTVGQPVKYKNDGVLRVCIGAPLLVDMIYAKTPNKAFEHDKLILQKASLCGKYFAHLSQTAK